MTRNLVPGLLAVLALSGCQTTLPMPAMVEPEVVRVRDQAPPGAAPGTCWGKDVTPAVVETVTEQVQLQPAEVLSDGTMVRPAIYKTETRQAIVQERRETWFEVPCEGQMTPDFIASVQRALTARGHYRGPVHGTMDRRTRAAIRAYQKPQGLDSGILSLAAARQMGLVAVAREATPETEPDTEKAGVAVAKADDQADKAAKAKKQAEAKAAAEAEAAAKAAAEAERARKAQQEAAEKAAELEKARKDQAAAQAEKAKRQAELEKALEAEKNANASKTKSLPISSESD